MPNAERTEEQEPDFFERVRRLQQRRPPSDRPAESTPPPAPKVTPVPPPVPARRRSDWMTELERQKDDDEE